jgi:uncharacterized membrane protein YdfJ with MMPL/SSD domain
VVLALLTLVAAVAPATRSLGAQAGCGLVVTALFVLLVLPPILGLFGRPLFWPFIPRPGGDTAVTAGVWHRIAAWGHRSCRPRSRHGRGAVSPALHRAVRHTDRVVADRTIPGEI